jgi:hypothetical protein
MSNPRNLHPKDAQAAKVPTPACCAAFPTLA